MACTWHCKKCDGMKITPSSKAKTTIRQGVYVVEHDGVLCTNCTSGTALVWMMPLPERKATK